MENNWLNEIAGKNQVQAITAMNDKTERFGLMLTEEDAKLLVENRKQSLLMQQRVEFGVGILPKLIFTFCDSPNIDQDNYVDTLISLQEIFYRCKNESLDELTDDELLEYMKSAFDGVCQGSLEYLEDTALESITREVREQGKNFFKNYRLKGSEPEDEL